MAEVKDLCPQLLSLMLPLHRAAIKKDAAARAEAWQECEVHRFKQKLACVHQCCPVCYKILSSAQGKEQHMKAKHHQ